MSEIERIFLTSGLTICGGVLVIVLGQVFIRFFLDPITNLRKLLGEIADNLVYYGNIYSNPGVARDEVTDKARKSFRQNAGLLRSRAHAIPLYPLFAIFKLVPRQNHISEASQNLIGLSNSLIQGEPRINHDRAHQIRVALRLPIE